MVGSSALLFQIWRMRRYRPKLRVNSNIMRRSDLNI